MLIGWCAHVYQLSSSWAKDPRNQFHFQKPCFYPPAAILVGEFECRKPHFPRPPLRFDPTINRNQWDGGGDGGCWEFILMVFDFGIFANMLAFICSGQRFGDRGPWWKSWATSRLVSQTNQISSLMLKLTALESEEELKWRKKSPVDGSWDQRLMRFEIWKFYDFSQSAVSSSWS